MPVVSQVQDRAMRSAAAGHSTLGIPASVGKLPQRVKAKQPRQLPVFGSLAPAQPNPDDAATPE